MVDWKAVLENTRLFHTSGITFGLANHSQYKRNYCYHAFMEALSNKSTQCKVGLDFNYRGTLWPAEMAREIMTPILEEHVDILITTIEDMAKIYDFDCGQYSAKQIIDGDMGAIHNDDLQSLAQELIDKFNLAIVAITIRYPDSFEEHRWESAAMDKDGNYYRSPSVKRVTLLDRLGGGDTWNAGFYYGLLSENFHSEGLTKGVLVGDAATRLKQTLMFDLPVLDKEEIEALMKSDSLGGGKRTYR